MLSTPPAFILSQDQTLVLKFVPSRIASSFSFRLLSWVVFFYSVFAFTLLNNLKDFQGCIVVWLSRFCVAPFSSQRWYISTGRDPRQEHFLTFFIFFQVHRYERWNFNLSLILFRVNEFLDVFKPFFDPPIWWCFFLYNIQYIDAILRQHKGTRIT